MEHLFVSVRQFELRVKSDERQSGVPRDVIVQLFYLNQTLLLQNLDVLVDRTVPDRRESFMRAAIRQETKDAEKPECLGVLLLYLFDVDVK